MTNYRRIAATYGLPGAMADGKRRPAGKVNALPARRGRGTYFFFDG
jgi:hypothetical protein